MKIRSVKNPAMFLLLGAFFWPLGARGWNPDVAYGLPLQRRMCVSREVDDTVHFSSVSPQETCPPGARRYVVVFGKEPRGSVAMLPITTAQRFYPPLVLSWPEREGFNGNPLWHFTCIETQEINLLESKLTVMGYRGEITTNGSKDCLEAQQRAMKYCETEWQGDDLLEKCPLSWGI